MARKDLIVGIAGAGGDGVVSAGELVLNIAALQGLFGMLTKSFGPQIRGGESSVRLRLSVEPVLAQGDELDVLIAFNWADYGRFRTELVPNEQTIIFVDEQDKTPDAEIPLAPALKAGVHRVSFEQIAVEKAGTALAKNIVAVGVLAAALALPPEGFAHAIARRFQKKGQQVVDANVAAFDAGAAIGSQYRREGVNLTPTPSEPLMVIAGNDATGFGALVAGCRFIASYPITPQSEVMEYLNRELPKFGGTMIQGEDELASIAMAIGASYAGVKSMTASSGPGISLKQEAIGLASIAEIPLVVLNVQRVGPSTGIPTKTEQGDLLQGIFGTHGDASKVVVGTTDVEDCFWITAEAFNIAEEYQLPVLILSDQFIGHRTDIVRPFDLSKVRVAERQKPTEAELAAVDHRHGFERFAYTADGVSPMSVPGMPGGSYLNSGLEHDVVGAPASGVVGHQKMTEKRWKKLDTVTARYGHLTVVAGDPDAELGIMAWGASKGAVLEAVEVLCAGGVKAKAVVPRLLWPLPLETIEPELERLTAIHVVELSYSGQLFTYLKSQLRADLAGRLVRHARAGGAPLGVSEVLAWVKAPVAPVARVAAD
ncbi:MAG: 2-oxoacid:acceptor oxidoreductase subunit alpha [Gemmatimonadota bacterium]